MKRRFSLRRRASGLLLHPTSLPGGAGIGEIGPAARGFVDFLAAAGQTWWQMLPVGPADGGGSPYVSSSAFAGNPLLISLGGLVSDGLLETKDLAPLRGLPRDRVDYPAVGRLKEACLRAAFRSFEAGGGSGRGKEGAAFRAFSERSRDWLPDLALFSALKRHHGGVPWERWPDGLRRREAAAVEEARAHLAGEIRYQAFVQFLFGRQWTGLRSHARSKGVGLIGDVPIYVSRDSAEVWANQDLFRLDADGLPEVVAGVPPDYFNEDGQLWGNPLYRWDALRRRGYAWWIARLRQALRRFDALRLDHFIGFVRYWEIPRGAATAKAGRWREGPGEDFFRAVFDALGPVELIAEDLGSVTPEVHALAERFGIPGMRVLQFGFDGDPANPHLPRNHPRRCVAYTGTHDNDTAVGWFTGSDPGLRTETPEGFRLAREAALRLLESDGSEIHWDMIRAVLASRADTAIVAVQDLLGLGSEARMNRPGLWGGNWSWRLTEGALTPALCGRLRALTRATGRLPGRLPGEESHPA